MKEFKSRLFHYLEFIKREICTKYEKHQGFNQYLANRDDREALGQHVRPKRPTPGKIGANEQ